MGEGGAVVSKQQFSDEFLNSYRACEETPQVEQTAVCSETDVEASRSMVLKKMENTVAARTHPFLMPLETGKLHDRDPLCFT